MSVKVDEVEFIKVIREVGRNGVIELGVGSKTIKVMVADYQFDPLKNQITHIDFLAINMSEERTVEVPVQLVGEAVGAKEGGVVEQPLFNLEVTATPDNIPEAIEVDITELNINDSLTVADVKVTGDFKIENDSAESVVTVVAQLKNQLKKKSKLWKANNKLKNQKLLAKAKTKKKLKSNFNLLH